MDPVSNKSSVLSAAGPKLDSRLEPDTGDQNSSTIETEIRKLLQRVTDVPMVSFKDDSTLEDLGVDSLMIAEVMSEVCRHFKLEISAADFANLLNMRSLRSYLLARGCGSHGEISASDINSDSGEEPVSPTPTSTAATSIGDVTTLRGDLHSNLARLVASHLESDMCMTRETNLANEGLDSLLCIELANDIKKDFGATIDMSLLNGDSTFGDLLDMVASQCQPSLPLGKAAVVSTIAAPTPAIKISTDGSLTPAEGRLAPVGNAQQAFEDIRFNYDVFAKHTRFADFWKKDYPTQARLVLAYTVEAFARLGCRLTSLKAGQRLPRMQFNPKYNLLMDQLHKVIKDASVVKANGAHLVRSDKPVD